MQKYSESLLTHLTELLETERSHRQISISAGDLLGWCRVAYIQADGAYFARHRHRARWLQRDVLLAYGRAGYVPLGQKYFVAGLRDAVNQLRRETIAHIVRIDTEYTPPPDAAGMARFP